MANPNVKLTNEEAELVLETLSKTIHFMRKAQEKLPRGVDGYRLFSDNIRQLEDNYSDALNKMMSLGIEI